MPAFTMSSKLRTKPPDNLPPPNAYDQIHGSIGEEVIKKHEIEQQRNAVAKKLRDSWKNERKKVQDEKNPKQDENNVEEVPATETMPLQNTETHTRSDQVNQKPQNEKQSEKPKRKKKEEEVIERSTIPPGPGQYNIPDTLIHKNGVAKFGKAPTKYFHVKECPAPNTYNIPAERPGTKYSLGVRFDGIQFDHPDYLNRRKLVEKDVSQPEYLCLRSTIGSAPGVRINPPTKAPSIDRTLPISPASYYPRSDNPAPSYTLLGKPSYSQKSFEVPEPCKYDVIKAFNYTTTSLSTKFSQYVPDAKLENPNDVPGPGNYNPQNLDRVLSPRFVQKVGFRRNSPESKTAKPKQKRSLFNLDKQAKTDRHTFGNAPKEEIKQKFITPAPNAYQDIEMNWKKKEENEEDTKERCTFGMKTQKFFIPNKNPGPGTHYPEIASARGVFFSVGKGSRSNQALPIYTDKYYDVPSIFHSPKVSFGKEEKQKKYKKSKFPGPGTYNVSGIIGELPVYASKMAISP